MNSCARGYSSNEPHCPNCSSTAAIGKTTDPATPPTNPAIRGCAKSALRVLMTRRRSFLAELVLDFTNWLSPANLNSSTRLFLCTILRRIHEFNCWWLNFRPLLFRLVDCYLCSFCKFICVRAGENQPLISILLSSAIALGNDRQGNPTICIRTFHPRLFTQNIISVALDQGRFSSSER